jgi:ubiquinone/menaquinone biosynthesis C-methylase UbiE
MRPALWRLIVEGGDARSNEKERWMDTMTVEQAVGKVFAELGIGCNLPLVALGDRLGLWKAMAGAGPLTPAELAVRTGTVERYVLEWLSGQYVSGYVAYDPVTGRFELGDAMAAVVAEDEAPTSLIGVLGAGVALWADLDRSARLFREGGGVGWGDHHPALADGQERFTRPMYTASLPAWIDAVHGLTDRLRTGAAVADVGCGRGVSTIMLAEAFPQSDVSGFDIDDDAIAHARKAAARAGVADRVTFEVADAAELSGRFDLVLFTDCLHDLGDPTAAAAQARRSLAPGGVCLVIEPNVADRLEDNRHNPYAPIGYAVSTLVCTPSSLAQEGAAGLGTMAGPARIRQVLEDAGFADVRRVAEDLPFNLVFEARD